MKPTSFKLSFYGMSQHNLLRMANQITEKKVILWTFIKTPPTVLWWWLNKTTENWNASYRMKPGNFYCISLSSRYFLWQRILHQLTKQIQAQNQKIYFSMLMLCILCILHLHTQQRISHSDCALSSETNIHISNV